MIFFGPTYASAASFADLGRVLSSVLEGQMSIGWLRLLSQLRQQALLLMFSLPAGQPRCCNRVCGRKYAKPLESKLRTEKLSLLPHSFGCGKLQSYPRLKSWADRFHVLMGELESHNSKGVDKEPRVMSPDITGDITVIRLPFIGILHFSKIGFKIIIIF